MLLHIASPSPVPDDLVVKFGTNIFDCISDEIPSPLSFTLTRIVPLSCTSSTSILHILLSPHASMAFVKRLVNKRFICVLSAFNHTYLSTGRHEISTLLLGSYKSLSEPITSCRSKFSTFTLPILANWEKSAAIRDK